MLQCHSVGDEGWHASGLALLGVSLVRLSLAQWALLEPLIWVNIQRITEGLTVLMSCASI
jgi:hypothetical protein